jgi:hypothetical protein
MNEDDEGGGWKPNPRMPPIADPASASQVEVTLVDRSDFNIRGKVVSVGKHPAREPFVFFAIAGEYESGGAYR